MRLISARSVVRIHLSPPEKIEYRRTVASDEAVVGEYSIRILKTDIDK